MLFGASSPITMCSAVTSEKAMMNEIAWIVVEPIERQEVDHILDDDGHSRFADPAQRQAGNRDPELGRGNVGVEVGEPVEDTGSARLLPSAAKLLDARAAHGNKGEFGCDEETVGKNEQNHGDQALGWY